MWLPGTCVCVSAAFSIYSCVCVCLSVHTFRNHGSKLHQTFRAYYLWSWLSRHLKVPGREAGRNGSPERVPVTDEVDTWETVPARPSLSPQPSSREHDQAPIYVTATRLIIIALPFEPVVRSRSILGLGLPSSANVIANDHYQSIGIVCLSVIRGVSRVSGRSALIGRQLTLNNKIHL